MRACYQIVLCVILFCCTLLGQKVNPPSGPVKPGEQVTLSGESLEAVTAVALKAEGKPDLPTTGLAATANSVKFTVPGSAAGAYKAHLTGVSVPDVDLTVAAAAAAASATPVIDSIFQTTIYPVQDRFTFEINGQNFDPDPVNDEVEVQGQNLVPFGSRHKSPDRVVEHKKGTPLECSEEDVKDYACLEASPDGRRLLVHGFRRRYDYQGPISVRVWVKGAAAPSGWNQFKLSRVDPRIAVGLALGIFALLMYIVYRLVSRGMQDYMVAGEKYGPLAAFLIDKTTDTYSLSKFQLFALSVVMFFGYVYVFLCRALVQWNFTFPEIPDNYPSLLAISAGTTAAAAGLNATRGGNGGGPVHPSAADFISNGGLVVADRFQFFVWTLIACLGFIALLLLQDPAKIDGFPTFPSGLLYVMGVSAAGYVGGKAVRNPGPILKQVEVSNLQIPNPNAPGQMIDGPDLSVTLKGENLDQGAKFRIDGALQAVVGNVNATPQPQAPQGYSTQLVMTLSQAGQFVTGDHVFEIVNGDGIGAQAVYTGAPMKIPAPPAAINHPDTQPVTLTVLNYREGCSARWLPPGASTPVDIPVADVTRTAQAPAGDTVVVRVPSGDKAGTGTLTLVSPRGGTEATSVTVN